MAKAKKPTSTGDTPAGKSGGTAAKSTGSVPKVSSAKTSGTSATAAKTPEADKAKSAETTKASTSKKSDVAKTDVNKADVKPAEIEAAEKPTPAVSKTPEPTKAEAKPATPPTPKQTQEPAQTPEKSGSIFWPLLLGGALAAVLGFFAAEMNMLGTRGDTADLRASLQDQQEQIAALEAAEPQIEMPDLEPLTTQVTTLSEALSALDARLTEVENRPAAPATDGGASSAAYEAELQALQASVEEQRAEIQGLLNNARSVEEATADAARNATLQAALTRVTAAISAGQPFAEPLADLEANGLGDIPAALADTAESGVVTLTNLQTRFPDTARAVLSSTRSSGSDEGASGFGGFLKRQLGARSVAPREGSDPDAVLSRAEAAVRDGRLADALTELDALPEISQSDLDAWLADARARQDAQTAAENLSQRLTAN